MGEIGLGLFIVVIVVTGNDTSLMDILGGYNMERPLGFRRVRSGVSKVGLYRD